MNEMLKKVPWKKVGQIGGYVAVAAIAVVKSISEDKEKADYEALKKEVASLKEMYSESN